MTVNRRGKHIFHNLNGWVLKLFQDSLRECMYTRRGTLARVCLNLYSLFLCDKWNNIVLVYIVCSENTGRYTSISNKYTSLLLIQAPARSYTVYCVVVFQINVYKDFFTKIEHEYKFSFDVVKILHIFSVSWLNAILVLHHNNVYLSLTYANNDYKE